jgi:plasmid maintenance system antidote protein VapI
VAAHPTPARSSDPGVVLAKGVGRAAALLGMTGSALARTVGASEATVSRILNGERPLNPDTKEGELAALLIRLYRSLDALVGNDGEKRLAWMNSHNRALGGVPRDLVQKAEGLCAAVAYLDGMRATL